MQLLQKVIYASSIIKRRAKFILGFRFVHPKCDPDADLVSYQHKKETNPEYEYVCLVCKNMSLVNRQMIMKRKDSKFSFRRLCLVEHSLKY